MSIADAVSYSMTLIKTCKSATELFQLEILI